jgi:flagellar biosynthesis/type III secretory pathway ATPase
MLDRRLAVRSHYPPIAVLDSVSRLMPSVASAPHLEKAYALRRLLAAYTASEDLIRIGAYQKGGDRDARQSADADSRTPSFSHAEAGRTALPGCWRCLAKNLAGTSLPRNIA